MKQKSTLSKMTFLPSKKTAEFADRPSVLSLAIDLGLKLSHSCGGMGSCGTCRVIVKSDLTKLEERNEVEMLIAEDRKFEDEERLACQTRAFSGLMVEVPKSKIKT
jgi:2Fe-2S ferredoxin